MTISIFLITKTSNIFFSIFSTEDIKNLEKFLPLLYHRINHNNGTGQTAHLSEQVRNPICSIAVRYGIDSFLIGWLKGGFSQACS